MCSLISFHDALHINAVTCLLLHGKGSTTTKGHTCLVCRFDSIGFRRACALCNGMARILLEICAFQNNLLVNNIYMNELKVCIQFVGTTV